MVYTVAKKVTCDVCNKDLLCPDPICDAHSHMHHGCCSDELFDRLVDGTELSVIICYGEESYDPNAVEEYIESLK